MSLETPTHSPHATAPRLPPELSLRNLIDLSDEELARYDIAELHLRCAEGLPGAENLNIPDCLKALDDCAEAVREGTKRLSWNFRRCPSDFQDSQAVFRCAVLSAVLQERFRVKINLAMNQTLDATFFKDSRNSFFHGVLNDYHGACLPMSVLYMAVGRRLGYPLKLIRTMQHCFARWEDGQERFNIECAIEGFATPPDSYYLEWPHKLTAEQANDLRMLRSMTPRQELAQFFFHRGYCQVFTTRSHDAMQSIFWGHSLAPDDPNFVLVIDILLKVWRQTLELHTRSWFPPVEEIIWPAKRRLPDCVPIEAEREFIRLGIWEELLKEPQWRPSLQIPPPWYRPKPIRVRCE